MKNKPIGEVAIIVMIYAVAICYAGVGIYHTHFMVHPRYCVDQFFD